MYYEYSFSAFYKPELRDFLKANGIKYKPANPTPKDRFVWFSVYSNSANCDEIIKKLQEMKVAKPARLTKYTKEEIESAQLLIIRPARHSIEITNYKSAYECTCTWIAPVGRGLEMVKHRSQKDIFAIRKELPMKNSAAFSNEDTGQSEIFVDSRILKLTQDNSLRGLDFEKVYRKKGVYSDNTFHLKSTNIIPKESICKGEGLESSFCKFCGREQYIMKDPYQLRLKGTPDDYADDMYMTDRFWGPGIDSSKYMISQRFYRLLVENKLNGKLVVEPVFIGEE